MHFSEIVDLRYIVRLVLKMSYLIQGKDINKKRHTQNKVLFFILSIKKVVVQRNLSIKKVVFSIKKVVFSKFKNL